MSILAMIREFDYWDGREIQLYCETSEDSWVDGQIRFIGYLVDPDEGDDLIFAYEDTEKDVLQRIHDRWGDWETIKFM